MAVIAMLYDIFAAPFADFAFMRRALVGACVLGLAGGPIGVFLILRRMALTGDAISHAILPGAALGYLLFGLSVPWMSAGGLLAGLIVMLLSGNIARTTILEEDTALAGLYLISLALGVCLIALRGSALDLIHILFGQVLALDNTMLVLCGSASTFSLMILAILYRPLVMETLEPDFLASISKTGAVAHYGFLIALVVLLVAGFQALGTLLAVGMMMLPAACARLWTKRLDVMLALAMGFALVASYFGLVLSYHFSTPAGPAIILVAGVFYVVSLCCVNLLSQKH